MFALVFDPSDIFLLQDGSGEISTDELEDPLLSTGIAKTVADVEALVEDVMEEEELKAKESGSPSPTFYHETESAADRDLIMSPELQKSAEEILAGIKRPTAVIGNEVLEPFSSIQDLYDRET